MENLILEQAVEILNRVKYLTFYNWHIVTDPGIDEMTGPFWTRSVHGGGQYPYLLTEFEAVAIAEKYERNRLGDKYVLVPRTPTKEMLDAAWASALAEDAAGVWAAMIEASNKER